MKATDIQKQTTVMRFENIAPVNGLHESLFRSYAIVGKLRDLIEAGTPHEVMLELLDVMTEGNNYETFGLAASPPKKVQ